MKYDKLIEILFSTKNYNKILAEFNKLSLHEKEYILSNSKVKQRIYKIADINLLVNILIDLPYEFRVNFLRPITYEKYNHEYEKSILEFLKLSNYEEFEYKQLSVYENIKDKQALTLMFRRFSVNKLKSIILANYCQFINDYAFTEYCKKVQDLNLESDVINNVSDNILFSELKRRKSKQKITNIEINEFIKLSAEKQNGILLNCRLDLLENEIIKAHQDRNSISSTQELIYRFESALQNFNYAKLIELQTIIYNIDEENAIMLMQMFFKNVLKFENDVEQKYLKSMIFQFKKLNDKTHEIFDIAKKKPFTIINFLNTGSINDDLDKILDKQITIEQYQKINIKKINRINKLLNKLYSNSDSISQDNWIVINSHKLYLIFGYENSIELLSGKFGNIDYKTLAQLLNKCNVKNVIFKSINNLYEPVLNQDFIQFFIGEKKDNNTTIKRMLRGELDIIKDEFSNLYNNFERFQHAIGNKIHLNKLLPLLQENPFMLLPNEYKLTKDLIDNIIKSYGYTDVFGEQTENNDNSKEYVMEACNFYHNYLEKRIISSIPRVKGNTEDKYSYEVLKLDDPVIMTLGYQTGCCFRLNGLSKEFLRYCSESIYARVIVIKNETGEICSMIPIIRNGNVIVGNSIETNSKGDSEKVYNTLKKAYDEILKISNEYEENPIIACLVSNLHSNCYSKKNVSQKIFPIRNDSFYTNYDSETYIVSIKKDKEEKDFELYVPNAIYFDERPEILVYHWGMNNITEKIEVEKRIKSIQYKLNQSNEEYMYFAHYIICSEDWFLKVDYDGISGQYIEKDPRAIEEFNAIKNYLEQKFANKRIYEVNIDETNLTGNLNSIAPKKLVLKKEQ